MVIFKSCHVTFSCVPEQITGPQLSFLCRAPAGVVCRSIPLTAARRAPHPTPHRDSDGWRCILTKSQFDFRPHESQTRLWVTCQRLSLVCAAQEGQFGTQPPQFPDCPVLRRADIMSWFSQGGGVTPAHDSPAWAWAAQCLQEVYSSSFDRSHSCLCTTETSGSFRAGVTTFDTEGRAASFTVHLLEPTPS